MPNLLLVMIGGAVGAGLRYETGRVALRQWGAGFPWGTLIVNLVGGLLMGILAGWLLDRAPASHPSWLLLGVGVLGGFTTFSAFSLEMFAMLERGEIGAALAYAAGSVAGAVLLLFVGFRAVRAMLG